MIEENEKPNATGLISLFIIFCLSAVLVLILGAKYLHDEKPPETKPILSVQRKLPDTSNCITAWITYYQPTLRQCNSVKGIGYWGDTLHQGDCAVSSKILELYVNYKDSVEIISGIFKGVYCCKDRAGSKALLIDVFKPVTYNKGGCYRSKIRIKQ